MRKDVGRSNVLYVHVTLLPALAATGELKTKPTQHSVKELRGIGIQPDVIVLRSDQPVPRRDPREDRALLRRRRRGGHPGRDRRDHLRGAAPVRGAGPGRARRARARPRRRGRRPDLTAWRALVERIKAPKPELEIALVGKYIELPDAYLSVTEALRHAGWAHDRRRQASAGSTPRRSPPENVDERLAGAAGVLVPGGFGHRGIEGKVLAARYAREHGPVPRACASACSAASSSSPATSSARRTPTRPSSTCSPTHPVIDFMPDQRDMEDKGGTMRLGLYPAKLTPGSKAAAAYGAEVIYERHRHRFEVNNRYREALEAAGMVLSGQSPDGRLVEIVELRDHPWFVASQFHPEFKSRPDRPHPLFDGFVAACISTAADATGRSAEPLPEPTGGRPSRPSAPRHVLPAPMSSSPSAAPDLDRSTGRRQPRDQRLRHLHRRRRRARRRGLGLRPARPGRTACSSRPTPSAPGWASPSCSAAPPGPSRPASCAGSSGCSARSPPTTS